MGSTSKGGIRARRVREVVSPSKGRSDSSYLGGGLSADKDKVRREGPERNLNESFPSTR